MKPPQAPVPSSRRAPAPTPGAAESPPSRAEPDRLMAVTAQEWVAPAAPLRAAARIDLETPDRAVLARAQDSADDAARVAVARLDAGAIGQLDASVG